MTTEELSDRMFKTVNSVKYHPDIFYFPFSDIEDSHRDFIIRSFLKDFFKRDDIDIINYSIHTKELDEWEKEYYKTRSEIEREKSEFVLVTFRFGDEVETQKPHQIKLKTTAGFCCHYYHPRIIQ